ncbi:hypothetical protein D3C73_1653340 [compost metagenome]
MLFLIFVDVEFCEMLLVAPHDVKTRLLGALVRNDRQFFGEIGQFEMILDCHPLLRSASGR